MTDQVNQRCCHQSSRRPRRLYPAFVGTDGQSRWQLDSQLYAIRPDRASTSPCSHMAGGVQLAVILPPDESKLHSFCARQLTLRELDYAADGFDSV